MGVFPFRTHMTQKSMKMGYVSVKTRPGCPMFPPNVSVRGHIYHFSEILEVGPESKQYLFPLCKGRYAVCQLALLGSLALQLLSLGCALPHIPPQRDSGAGA